MKIEVVNMTTERCGLINLGWGGFAGELQT